MGTARSSFVSRARFETGDPWSGDLLDGGASFSVSNDRRWGRERREVENPTEISYSGAKRRGGDGEVRARRQTDETKIETNGGGGV